MMMMMMMMLINDINVMWEHLHRAHMQYRAYKKACIDAGITNESIATAHIDWAENARIRQAREEKGGIITKTTFLYMP